MTLVHLGKSVTTIEDWNVRTLWGGMKVVLIVNIMCHKHKIYHNQRIPNMHKTMTNYNKNKSKPMLNHKSQ